jgi:hypothetical protein
LVELTDEQLYDLYEKDPEDYSDSDMKKLMEHYALTLARFEALENSGKSIRKMKNAPKPEGEDAPDFLKRNTSEVKRKK